MPNADNMTQPYRVRAYNTAFASENKIHDDAVAQRFGFKGGLVPGVEVYAYMTHLALARWGREWLEHGGAECRFLSPVYDGKTVEISGADGVNSISIRVESEGFRCAEGSLTFREGDGPPPRMLGIQAPLPPSARPPADALSLAVGTRLGIAPFPVTAEYAAQYLADVRETDPIYAREALAHPGIVLRLCNQALVQNVLLGPWIHVGSTVRNLSAAKVGDTLSVSACVTANYERKGHSFVDLDVLVSADDRPIAEVTHVAIYRPRQTAAA